MKQAVVADIRKEMGRNRESVAQRILANDLLGKLARRMFAEDSREGL